MKRWKYLLAALFIFAMQGVAHAQALKIGLVDFQKALNEVEEGKRAKANLKSQFEAKQKTLVDKQNALKALKDQLEAQSAALSADAMKQKQAEYRDKFMELNRILAESQNEIATKEGEITKTIVQKLRKTVSTIGAQDGYALIFETSQDAVLYAPQATDITVKVIQAYNAGK